MRVRVCCVCHRPLEDGARTIGRRCYCDGHYANVTRERDHFWQTGWVLVAALIGFVLLVVGIDSFAQPTLEGRLILVIGMVMALVPAVMWLIFFYLQDRLEPEPKRYVVENDPSQVDLGTFRLASQQ
ncbi:MAG: hypothetical protein CEE40_12430 [Chloroflexi bacterium B3_Chlor]|nr:MAG: hypothetical protein CEE40_12430 [Chloroflexi bacterium B3_Chlor]